MQNPRPRKVKIQISPHPDNYKQHFWDAGKLSWPPRIHRGAQMSETAPHEGKLPIGSIWECPTLPPLRVLWPCGPFQLHRILWLHAACSQLLSSNNLLFLAQFGESEADFWWAPSNGLRLWPTQGLFCRKCFLELFDSSQIKPCNWPLHFLWINLAFWKMYVIFSSSKFPHNALFFIFLY